MIAMLQNGAMQQFTTSEQTTLIGGAAMRLLTAAVLGGIIGLDREVHRKASGMRTNLLICFGAAMFTFLSPVIAGATGSNKGQVAANVVQGIGFLGAGLILHNRVRVSGLTSAATVFAVASIGMACGAGLYPLALFAAGVVLVTLEVITQLENRAGLKAYALVYEVRARDADRAAVAMLAAMDAERRRLEIEKCEPIGGLDRLTFELSAQRNVHRRLRASIASSEAVERVMTFKAADDD